MSSIVGMSAGEMLSQLEQRKLSSVEATTACLSVIDRLDSKVAAFLHVDRDGAVATAAAIDARRQRGEPVGVLAGLPVGIKDVLCTRGLKTTCASRMLENFVPPYDAHVVERLRAADAVLIGKLNMDEFAMGSSTENSAFRPTFNPWDLTRTPGGSSGGSAAAVAAAMCPVSIGSDTGGSIRQPASFCGVVGMKPTYGRVSRYGLIAYASSLDQLGPFSNDVTGAARLLLAISGHDRRDSTSLNQPAAGEMSTLDQPLSGLRIGLAREHFAAGLDSEVESAIREAARVYEKLGAKIVDIGLPHSKYAVATYYIIAASEASSNLARYDGVHYGHRSQQFSNMAEMYAASRGEGFGAEVKARIMLGNYALSSGYYDAYYLKALKVRRLIRNDFDAAFKAVDVVLSPVAPSPAFKVGEMSSDPLAMYLSDIYTISANLGGLPGISVPAGFNTAGLPIGMQLMGPPLSEWQLLRAARMYERETSWHLRRPAIVTQAMASL